MLMTLDKGDFGLSVFWRQGFSKRLLGLLLLRGPNAPCQAGLRSRDLGPSVTVKREEHLPGGGFDPEDATGDLFCAFRCNDLRFNESRLQKGRDIVRHNRDFFLPEFRVGFNL